MWLCKRDLTKECEGKYRDCTDCVLDKIRAEIESVIQEETVIDHSGGEYEHVESKLEPDDVFQIIDKYKAESEGKK